MWQDEKLLMYALEDDIYQEILSSKLLPDLNIALLEKCVLMPSRLEAIQTFTVQAESE